MAVISEEAAGGDEALVLALLLFVVERVPRSEDRGAELRLEPLVRSEDRGAALRSRGDGVASASSSPSGRPELRGAAAGTPPLLRAADAAVWV